MMKPKKEDCVKTQNTRFSLIFQIIKNKKTTIKNETIMKYNLLKQLYKIHSKSGFEGEIITFICKWISKNIPSAKIDFDWNTGNIYITKGMSKTYPCIVAHLDQVQEHHPTDFITIETRDLIFGYSPKERKFCGLGADDKNGIWLALKCLQEFDEIKIAFFVCEEVGCIGSSKAKMDFFDDCRFVIQPDRRGSRDLITSISGLPLCSDEFIKDIHPEMFGYKETDGLMTDIEQLKEQGLNVSCINVSCGYYEPHTDNEYTDKKDLLNCLRFIEYIITNCNKVYKHDAKVEERAYFSLSDASWYIYDELMEIIQEALRVDPTLTPADIYAFYCTDYPFTMDDFALVYEDAMNGILYEKEEDLP